MAAESTDGFEMSIDTVVVGTVKVTNYTNKQRTGWVTTVVPLQEGLIFPGATQPQLTAVGATATDERVQWYPMGRKWGDGSYKYARCIFPVTIAAGTDGSAWTAYNSPAGIVGLPYKASNPGICAQYYNEKIITINTAVTPPRAFAFHTKTIAGIVQTTLQVRVDGVLTTVPLVAGSQVGEVDIEANPLGGNPSSAYSNVKVIRSIARTPIPYTGVPPGKPSFWIEVFLEYGHNCRQVKFWLAVGNSLVTAQSNPMWPNTGWSLQGPIEAIFTSPGTVHVRHEDSILPRRVEAVNTIPDPDIYTTTLTLVDPNDDISTQRVNQRALFPNASYHVYTGVIIFGDAPVVGMDEDNIEAEKQSDMWAISENWGDYNSFGPLGHLVPRPTNSFINSDASAYGMACHHANNDYLSMMSRPFWPGGSYAQNTVANARRDPWGEPVLSFSPQGYAAGGTGSDFGCAKGWHLARGKCPDMRALQLSVYQEACRQMWPREIDVSIVKAKNHKDPSQPQNYTNLWYWDTSPHIVNNQPFPPGADALGKLQNIGPSARTNVYTTGTSGGKEWTPWNREHIEPLWIMTYGLLSGDRWLVTNMLPELVENFVASWWPNNASAQSRSTIWHIHASRQEGRMQTILSHLYNLTGDIQARDICWDRMKTALLPLAEMNILSSKYPGNPAKVIKILMKRDNPQAQTATPMIRVWEECIAVKGLYYAYLNIIEQYQFEGFLYFTMAKLIARSFAMYMWRKNTWSANIYDPAQEQSYEPFGPASEGEALCPVFPHTGCSATLSTTQFPRQVSANQQPPFWVAYNMNSPGQGQNIYLSWFIPAIYLGWKWANEDGDSVWAQRCKEILDQIEPSAANRVGAYGWDTSFSQAWTDHAAIIADPFATRTLGSVNLSVTFSGFPSGITANLTRLANIAVTFAGTGNISQASLSGGNTPANKDLKSSVAGTSSVSAQLTIARNVDLTATLAGTSSLVATLTVPQIWSFTLTIRGTSSITAYLTVEKAAPISQQSRISGMLVNSSDIRVDSSQMPAQNQTFEVWAGNDHVVNCKITDVNGNPVNILNVSELIWGVLESPTKSAFFIRKDLTNGIAVTNGAAGEFAITLIPTDTASLDGNYYHECEMTLDGKDYTIFTGNVRINPTAIL